LAAGFEKNRNDSAILIFDTGRTLPPASAAEFLSAAVPASNPSSIFNKTPSKDPILQSTPPAEYIRASIEVII